MHICLHFCITGSQGSTPPPSRKSPTLDQGTQSSPDKGGSGEGPQQTSAWGNRMPHEGRGESYRRGGGGHHQSQYNNAKQNNQQQQQRPYSSGQGQSQGQSSRGRGGSRGELQTYKFTYQNMPLTLRLSSQSA